APESGNPSTGKGRGEARRGMPLHPRFAGGDPVRHRHAGDDSVLGRGGRGAVSPRPDAEPPEDGGKATSPARDGRRQAPSVPSPGNDGRAALGRDPGGSSEGNPIPGGH